MADQKHKASLLRLFRLAAEVQREAGVTLDGRDPAWRELCDSPDLPELSDDELRERLRSLAVVESDDDPASRAEAAERKARFEAKLTDARDELIAAVERGELTETFEVVKVETRGDEVLDETEHVC
jgi:predicted transcriptional regulator